MVVIKILNVLQWGPFSLGTGSISAGGFDGCSNLELDTVNDVLNLSGTTTIIRLFGNCTSLTTINNISSWDVSLITSMSSLFNGCTLFDDNLSNWDVSSVTNMSSMFAACSSFNNAGSTGIDLWDVSSVTNMSAMFSQATVFNQPIGAWNTSSVTNMGGVFQLATSFNQNISTWNVSSVTGMTQMFSGATSFDQNLGSWNVSSVLSMINMFNGVTLSTSNYNSLLNGWAALGASLQPSVIFNAGGSVYTISTAGASRNYLTSTKLWTISDGGGI